MLPYNNPGKITKLGDCKIMGLGEIVRYNNRTKIKNENVAEHTFYVAASVIEICEMFNLDTFTRLAALEMAVVHDIPEMYIGDIPWDTKRDNPQIVKALEEAEVKALEKNMPHLAVYYTGFLYHERHRTLPYLVTKLADTVSVLKYSNREIVLGNKTEDMRLINEDAKERVDKIISELEAKLNG